MKKYLEILITPIVVAVIGVYGTYKITEAQIESSKTLSNAQLAIQVRQEDENQRLKLLEIFAQQVMSNDASERKMALGLINILDTDLSKDMLAYLATYDPDKGVQEEARNLQERFQNSAKPLGYDNVKEMVMRIVARNYEVSFSSLSENSILETINPSKNMPMVGDITSIETIIDLEKILSCHVTDEVAMSIETVGDMVKVFESCFSSKKKT